MQRFIRLVELALLGVVPVLSFGITIFMIMTPFVRFLSGLYFFIVFWSASCTLLSWWISWFVLEAWHTHLKGSIWKKGVTEGFMALVIMLCAFMTSSKPIGRKGVF